MTRPDGLGTVRGYRAVTARGAQLPRGSCARSTTLRGYRAVGAHSRGVARGSCAGSGAVDRTDGGRSG